MSLKLEISGNYLKWTNGAGNPGRYPYRNARFAANDANETIEIFGGNNVNPLFPAYPFADNAASGSVEIDTVSPTKASATVQLASAQSLLPATATIQFNTALANQFSTATVTAATVVGADFATATITAATAIEGNTAIVNGLVYTGVTGTKADFTEFSVDTGNDETAADLADSITNDARSGDVDDVTATSASAVVTVKSTVRGTDGNTIPLSSSGATLAVSGAFLTGGAIGDFFTANGLVYTGVVGTKDDNTQFSVDTSDTAAGIDIVDSITNDTRPGTTGDLSATESTGVVTFTTDVLGTGGDAITLTSSDGGTLAVSGATFSGGVDADEIDINDLTYTAIEGSKGGDNTLFSIDTSNDAAATDLADSIDNDARAGGLYDLTATAATDTVTAVSTVGGTAGNAITLTSSDAGRLLTSGATFTGGLDDAEITMITVNSIDIMSGAETSIEDTDVLATQVAANITAHTSTPNYSAVAVGALITITPDDEDTDVNGYVVASTPVKATTTDINMAGADADIDTGAGVPFASWSVLVAWLEDNTGGELIP